MPLGGVVFVHIVMVCYVIYIGVGLSALLGWTDRVMRKPSERGPGTDWLHAFLCMYLKT